ncbi:MAG: Transaldolase, partial [uncultured Rubrobacteraceae bacterium]
ERKSQESRGVGAGDLDRLHLARRPRRGRGVAQDDRGRGRRRHLEPHHLPESHLRVGAIRRAARRDLQRDGGSEGDLPGAGPQGHPGRLRHPRARPRANRREGWLRLPRSLPEPSLRHPKDRRGGLEAARVGGQAKPAGQDTGHAARPRGHRRDHIQRQVRERNPDLLARALQGGREGVHPWVATLGGGGRRPVYRGECGELLREPGGHGGRREAGRGRQAGPQGQARDSEREDGVRGVRGDLLRRRLELLGIQRCVQATPPLGLDFDKESGLSGHHLRGQPRRSGYREHDACLHPGGHDGPRQHPPDPQRGPRRREKASAGTQGGRRGLRRRDRDAGEGGGAEVYGLFRRAARRHPREEPQASRSDV